MQLNQDDDQLPDNMNGVPNPDPAMGGQGREGADDTSERSSQRLRHKSRAVSLWDYERMVLEQFPIVYKVGVFVGIVASLALIGWMLSDIKGPRGRAGSDPLPALGTNTSTSIPNSPTAASPEAPTAEAPTAQPSSVPEQPTGTPTTTPQPIQINFNADSYSIVQGECTTLRWQVTGAEVVRVLDAEVAHTEAERVCPTSSRRYRLIAENADGQAESSFSLEVLEPTATAQVGCTGYDQDGQLICKETCASNDPASPCNLE